MALADELTATMIANFLDESGGGFYSTAAGDQNLVMRVKEDYDGAEPSGNAIAALNLLRLAELRGNDEYRKLAESTLKTFAARMASQPSAMPQMLVALLQSLTPPRQVVLAGEKTELKAMRDAYFSRFLPHHVVLWAGSVNLNPALAAMREATVPTAYVCEDFTCNLPVTQVASLTPLLQ
ncbi:MAG: hypothetical protein WKF37_08210 [Bryobacteraceae bacterium]